MSNRILGKSSISILSGYVLITDKCTFYYTYKMLKYTVKISHDCSYMFRSIWTIIREPMPSLAKVTILCKKKKKIRR
jgi:hypothetical protein